MKYVVVFIMLCSFFGCNLSTIENNRNKTNYGKIDDSNLKLKFGDIISFDGSNINAIVIDIINENDQYYFGISFMIDDQIFGRRIPEGFDGDCVNLIDVIYVKEDIFTDKIQIVKPEILNFNKIEIGAYGYVNNYEEILSDYTVGIERLKLRQTPCTNLTELNPVYEQYFHINQFK